MLQIGQDESKPTDLAEFLCPLPLEHTLIVQSHFYMAFHSLLTIKWAVFPGPLVSHPCKGKGPD
jgi:hypothetical protein